jgi:hypothetical protein
MKNCDCSYDEFGEHESTCPCYEWKYRLPCDGSDCDMLYNEAMIDRDRLQARLDQAEALLAELHVQIPE